MCGALASIWKADDHRRNRQVEGVVDHATIKGMNYAGQGVGVDVLGHRSPLTLRPCDQADVAGTPRDGRGQRALAANESKASRATFKLREHRARREDVGGNLTVTDDDGAHEFAYRIDRTAPLQPGCRIEGDGEEPAEL
jgi:hypothetical protein